MTDRVREATFNALVSAGAIDGAAVIDLFAGTGACGIEALSRGAASATFVDRERSALEVIRANLASTGLKGDVVASDVVRFLDRTHRFDLAFVCPPYAFEEWSEVLPRLTATTVVCETDHSFDVPSGWNVMREGRYGGTFVTILKKAE